MADGCAPAFEPADCVRRQLPRQRTNVAQRLCDPHFLNADCPGPLAVEAQLVKASRHHQPAMHS